MHTVIVKNKKTGETIYRKSHMELVRAVTDFNSQKRMTSEGNEVDLKSNIK